MLTDINPELLMMGGVFLGVLLLFEGLRQLVSRRETTGEARSRRMRMIRQGNDLAERLELLTPTQRKSVVPGLQDFETLLAQAGKTPRAMPWLLGMALAFFATALVTLRFLPGSLVLPLAALLALPPPLLYLLSCREDRRRKLVAQLPDALDLMARSLQSGFPVNASMRTVADTMKDPIATEFGIVVDQVAFGDELVVALRRLSDRVPTEDFRYLAASVSIQHGTGGNLGRVLSVLAQVIRGRAMMRRKIKAMSAEGRVSALILSCIPFLMVALNSVVSPEYYGGVVENPLFLPMAAIAVGLILTNALVMMKLVSFEI